MIFIPAILIAIAEAAVIGGLAGAVICGLEDKRNLQSDTTKELRTAHKCAAEGALLGGLFGAGSFIVGPYVGGVGSTVDDVSMPVLNTLDDAARSGISASDDIVIPAPRARSGGIGTVAKRLTGDISAPLRYEANASRALFYKYLKVPKNASPKFGFTYVVNVEGGSSRSLYKIGFTRNPLQRLRRIQADLNKFAGGKVRFTCIIPANNVRQLESAMLAAFDAQRIRDFAAGTEFFLLSAFQVKAACSL